MAKNNSETRSIQEQIETTAGFYGGVTYASLLGMYHTYTVNPQSSSFVPLTAVKDKGRGILFAVGVIPPASHVTGRLLDRSASLRTLDDQAQEAADAAKLAGGTVTTTEGEEAAGWTGDSTEGTPTSGKDKNKHIWARQIMLEAFREKMGREPTIEEIQYLQAVAFGETGYGAWGGKPEMAGSNNWGAEHCSMAQQKDPTLQSGLNALGSIAGFFGTVNIGNNCIPSSDSSSNGKGFNVSFKKFNTPKDGAASMIGRIMKGSPNAAAAVSGGFPIMHMSYGMRRDSYYGGFCRDATKKYGAQVGTAANIKDPDRNEGFQACAEEATIGHAKDIKRFINDIAFANGDPSALSLGSFADADAWYRTESPNAIKNGPNKVASGVVNSEAGDTSGWAGQGSKSANQASKDAAKEKNGPASLNYSELGKKFLAAQRRAQEETILAQQKMAQCPPLRMLVNPSSFSVDGEKIGSEGEWGRDGPIIQHWGDGQERISASGKVSGFYAIDTRDATGPGLSRAARSFSESYNNFLSLYFLYRNNGGLYTTDPFTGKSHLQQVGSVYIYYDSTLYIGSFDSFGITESDTSPHSLEYNFEFTVRAAFLLDSSNSMGQGYDYGAPGLFWRQNQSTTNLFNGVE